MVVLRNFVFFTQGSQIVLVYLVSAVPGISRYRQFVIFQRLPQANKIECKTIVGYYGLADYKSFYLVPNQMKPWGIGCSLCCYAMYVREAIPIVVVGWLYKHRYLVFHSAILYAHQPHLAYTGPPAGGRFKIYGCKCVVHLPLKLVVVYAKLCRC